MSDSGVRTENERTEDTASTPSAFRTVVLLVGVLGLVGALGYVYVTSLHELSMMMLGQMRSGYENFLLENMLMRP